MKRSSGAGATQDEVIKKDAYAMVQTEIARDLPYIPVVLNASQSFFNTADFTGWPSDDDLYAAPLPYLSTASASDPDPPPPRREVGPSPMARSTERRGS
ncbi:hypothetical protein JM654_08285 [Microbacterium oxydans]|nr:hypothetical protein [Microbacterium oxydans]